MKISVITVTFNAAVDLVKTIDSVAGQRYDDYEYIVVDGGSTDNTVSEIRQHEADITKWVSEPDTGIYNAMNKAVRMANGEYCIFMNAGDVFAHPLSLKAASLFLDDGFDVVTGREISTQNNKVIGYLIPPSKITLRHFYTTSISHQASFIRRQVLIDNPYDEQLRLVSDWKFWMQTLVLGDKSYRPIDVDIAIFNHDGLTYKQKELSLAERKKVLEELLSPSVRFDYDKQTYVGMFGRIFNKISRRIRQLIQIHVLQKKMHTVGNYFRVMGVVGFIHLGCQILCLLTIVIGGGRLKHFALRRFLYRKYISVIENHTYMEKEDLGFYPVWTCWWQGEKQMPLVPKICLRTLRHNLSNNQKVVLITKDNYSKYVSLPEDVTVSLEKGIISVTHFSDLLRYALLSRYGGLWIDATCLTTDKLPDLCHVNFYTSKNTDMKSDSTFVSHYQWASYLMGGTANRVFQLEYKLLLAYIKTGKPFVDYLLLDYFLDLIYRYDPESKQIIDNCSDSHKQILRMFTYLNNDYSEVLWRYVTENESIHKLSWKLSFKLYNGSSHKMTLFGKIIDTI